MSSPTDRVIRVGHSPDPDDAFMFYGLASGKVKLEGITIEHMLEDIQSLNVRAMKAELEVTAISAHAFPAVAEHYWIMRTGASMGEGYGPVIISRKYRTLEELKGKLVGTPGPLTTATLLFRTFTQGIRHIDMPFDAIMEAVDKGRVDAGLLIHEGQITDQSLGYHKILDFGEFWDSETGGLPLPLGLDVVRKDLGINLATILSHGLKESIVYGYAHQDEVILCHAMGPGDRLHAGREVCEDVRERSDDRHGREGTSGVGDAVCPGSRKRDHTRGPGDRAGLIPGERSGRCPLRILL
jgi:1,4-dihydroxy-6-naphthoate synthase